MASASRKAWRLPLVSDITFMIKRPMKDPKGKIDWMITRAQFFPQYKPISATIVKSSTKNKENFYSLRTNQSSYKPIFNEQCGLLLNYSETMGPCRWKVNSRRRRPCWPRHTSTVQPKSSEIGVNCLPIRGHPSVSLFPWVKYLAMFINCCC